MTTQIRSQRRKSRTALLHVDDMMPREALIFCPACKALDVIRFSGETWIPTRKFRQQPGGFFHDCGSAVPCRLHVSGGRASTGVTPAAHRVRGSRSTSSARSPR
jgi:hypothetical protein